MPSIERLQLWCLILPKRKTNKNILKNGGQHMKFLSSRQKGVTMTVHVESPRQSVGRLLINSSVYVRAIRYKLNIQKSVVDLEM